MASRHQDIETRMAAQNKAEDFFEKEFKYQYMDKGGIIYKYGIHSFYPTEEQKTNMKHITAFIRNTPDFFIFYNNTFQLVEVKSCSIDLWLKQVDFENYRKWNELHQLLFYIYSFREEGSITISFKKLDALIKKSNFRVDKHHDSWKKCWVIPFKDINESL
tara:strand:- start:915 stop:1397 length:483 start_codon:yes stop_codon:yes gene_type:complete